MLLLRGKRGWFFTTCFELDFPILVEEHNRTRLDTYHPEPCIQDLGQHLIEIHSRVNVCQDLLKELQPLESLFSLLETALPARWRFYSSP